MKISFKGDYALKIILDLALNGAKALVQIKDIAKRQDIPEKYLEQIILILKGAKYITTRRGPSGGIKLSKLPSEITLGEIIRLMEGPTSPITCVSTSDHRRCSCEKNCVFRGVWKDIKDKINSVVDTLTFEDMAAKERALRKNNAFNYNI